MAGHPGWGRIARPLHERLWERIAGPWTAGVSVDDCWLFTGGYRTKWGHGRIALGGTASPGVPAHRVVYEQFWGPLMPIEVCRHECDVQLCCNPWHLVAGSQADNVRDQFTHGRRSRQEGH